MTIGDIDVGATAKATARDALEDDLQGAAAEVAYNFIFSMVPLLIFVTALSGVVARAFGLGENSTAITDWLFHRSGLPQETAAALQRPIEHVIRNQSGGILSVGLLLAIWGAKNAVSSLMKALNVAFDVEETRPWWKRTAVALGLTLALGVAFAGASALMIAGGLLGGWLAGALGLGGAWGPAWTLIRVVLVPAVLAVGLAFFYWAAPNVKAPFKWLTPGSVLAVVLWVVATIALQYYFTYAAGYVSAYGILGGMLALIFWFYVMSLILLIGGEVNAVLARAHSPETRSEVAAKARPGARVGVEAERGGAPGKTPGSSSRGVHPGGGGRPLAPAPQPGRAAKDQPVSVPRAATLVGYGLIALGTVAGIRRRRGA